MQSTTKPQTNNHRPEPDRVMKALDKRSFATLATSSPAQRPHVAGVLYEIVGDHLYVNTMRGSRKARNIEANQHVALCVPVRRLPVGPPSSIHFQATADLLDVDAPDITALVASGELASLTSHGELELVGGCFIRVRLPAKLLTYGLGMPLRKLIADPLDGAGSVERPTTTGQ